MVHSPLIIFIKGCNLYCIWYNFAFNFLLIFTFIQEIVIIKVTRLQAWAPAGGGERVGRRPPPPPPLKSFLAILGAFLLLFLHIWGLFRYVFLIFGGLFTMGGLFTLWWGPFFGLSPLPYENFCGRPWLQGGFESMLPGNFLCDRNLVSSGHVLLRFCLKNDKHNDKL